MSHSTSLQPGNLVSARNRQWIVQAKHRDGTVELRAADPPGVDRIRVYLALEGDEINPVESVEFKVNFNRDVEPIQLLSAIPHLPTGPFSVLNNVLFAPRPYQLVPLAMTARMSPVRILIADDVGVGKTLEAGLIAGEMIETSQIERFAVLCQSQLCEQWAEELREKFGFDPVVVRPSTMAELERKLPDQNIGVFAHYSQMVVSIDYAKSDRLFDLFVRDAPELVIVDEAHSAARPRDAKERDAQLRYRLCRTLADDLNRHLVLVTATPHSGIEESFRSLLGLLDEELERETADSRVSPLLRTRAIQRERRDLTGWLGTDTPFPELRATEQPYELGSEYSGYFDRLMKFCRDFKGRRLGHWARLSLGRSALSSPAAAVATLNGRINRIQSGSHYDDDPHDRQFAATVLDRPSDDGLVDLEPSVAAGAGAPAPGELEELHALLAAAEKLKGPQNDNKLAALFDVLKELIGAKHSPVVFCRFIDTAKYVAQELRSKFPKSVLVDFVTGDIPEEDRMRKVDVISKEPNKILVATECMSEGVNLQHGFSAVVHYDLPWNPMVLAQREGRVDRFGQPKNEVRSVLLFGNNNPIDRLLMQTLVRKYQQIRKDLGISVPSPEQTEGVIETAISELIAGDAQFEFQTRLDFGDSTLNQLERDWDQAARSNSARKRELKNGGLEPDILAEIIGPSALSDNERSVNPNESLIANCGVYISKHVTKTTAIVALRTRMTVESTQLSSAVDHSLHWAHVDEQKGNLIEESTLLEIENAFELLDGCIGAPVHQNVIADAVSSALARSTIWLDSIATNRGRRLERLLGQTVGGRRKKPVVTAHTSEPVGLIVLIPTGASSA